MTEVVKSADGTTLGKSSLWSRGQASVASLPRPGDHHVPVNVQSREVVRARLTRLSVANQRYRLYPAQPLAGTHIATGVIAPEYSLALLKSRPRLPEWLLVPLRSREALESSPGMRPQHRGSPPRRLPRQPFH